MALENVTQHTDRGAAINELQGLKTAVVAGALAVTNIPVAGISMADTIRSALMFTAGVPSDVTAEVSIPSAGNIQLATTDSTGNQLVVDYFVKPNK